MSLERGKKIRSYLQTAAFGIISVTSYVILFANQETVTSIFTRGGVFSAFPIMTVFYFSFVHGAFAGKVLSLLGIEAAKKRK